MVDPPPSRPTKAPPVLLVVLAIGAIVLISTILAGLLHGPPPWPRAVAMVTLTALLSAYPVEMRIGSARMTFGLGEMAVLMGFWLLGHFGLVWMPPLFALGNVLPAVLRRRLSPFKIVYNGAVRGTACAIGVSLAIVVTPGHPRLWQPWAVICLAIAGLTFAVVTTVGTVTAVAATQQLAWWPVAADGLGLDLIAVLGNIAASLGIFALAGWQPATAILLIPTAGALRYLYATSLRHQAEAEMSRQLAAATGRLSALSVAEVASRLAEAGRSLLQAASAEVFDGGGTRLASAGQALPGGKQLREPLLLADHTSAGQLQLTFPAATRLTARETQVLATLAAAAAPALVNAQRYEQARHKATHDALTGLLLRGSIDEAIAAAITAADEATAIALMWIDLDRFHLVNGIPGVGHPGADRVLQQVAKRIVAACPDGIAAARLGGDEFLVVLPGLPASVVAANHAAVDVATKILSSLREPVLLDSRTVTIHASLGVACWPHHAQTAEGLVEAADRAVFAAKRGGGNAVVSFDHRRDVHHMRRLNLPAALAIALDSEEEQLAVGWQPLIALDDGHVVAIEARLTHWQHPSLGLLPRRTIEVVAEESNLTDDLTRYLIYRALGQRSRWEDLLGAPVPIIVGINHRDLMSRSLPAALVDMLDATGSSSTQLVLEFGEPILQWDGTARAAAALSELGVSLSMDCFGTGRSSLPQLSTLPIDTIKIAQDLVARLDEAPVRRLVHAIIDSATQLGKDSAARGIEDVEQAQSLLDLGCEIGQGPSTQGNDGYLFGSPRPADELVDIIDRHPKTRRRSARVTHLDHHRPRRS